MLPAGSYWQTKMWLAMPPPCGHLRQGPHAGRTLTPDLKGAVRGSTLLSAQTSDPARRA